MAGLVRESDITLYRNRRVSGGELVVVEGCGGVEFELIGNKDIEETGL